MNDLLNKYYPLKSITIYDKDPYFITPEIKCLLRLKNKMMRSGRLQCADSLSRRICERIARCNANYFSNKNLTSRELWGIVRKLMGKEPSGEGQDSTFTATMLNNHYAKISTDPHYACPRLKCTASNDEIFRCGSIIFSCVIFFLLIIQQQSNKSARVASSMDSFPLVAFDMVSQYTHRDYNSFNVIREY